MNTFIRFQAKHGLIMAAALLALAVSLVSCSSKKSVSTETDLASSSLIISAIQLADASGDASLEIAASGEPKYNVFKLTDPDKVVIDVIDAKLGDGVPSSLPGVGQVQDVKVTALEDSLSSVVRVELTLHSAANYIANAEGGVLKVKVLGSGMPMAEATPSSAETPAPAAPAPDVAVLPPLPAAPEVATAAPTPAPEAAPAPEGAPMIAPNEMPSIATPQDMAKAETPAEIPAPAVEAPVAPAPAAPSVPEVVPMPIPLPSPMAEEKAVETPEPMKEMTADAEAPAKETARREKAKNDKIMKGVATQEIPNAGLTEGTSLLTELDSKVYSGKRVSLELQDADIQDILRMLADVSKLNIVTGDDVKGKVTLKLIDVPWDQALDIVLTTLGLDKVQHGNILRVAPVEKLKKEREIALANDKAAKQLEPLRLKLINVNYATADEMKDRIKNLLSDRGTIDTDPRTNTLIVKDIREHISRVENLIKALDTQTPQVRIEARIVQAKDSFSRSLGVQWGPTLDLSEANNKARNIVFPREIGIFGVPDGKGASASTISGFAVDATPGSTGSSLGFRLGSLANQFNLDLKLSYAESEDLARIVSRPSITTLDNRAAKIIQGTKIPFLSSSSDGSNVQFQEAGIEISVTPQITSDGAVIMKLSTKSNEPGSLVGGNFTILIREAQTEMLVKSAQTAVLGGVFRESETKTTAGVPYLKDIPVLGYLFKGQTKASSREETLIFVTPYILNDIRTASTAPLGAGELEP